MSGEKKWYAVYTRPRSEKKVSKVLSQNNVNSFCPLNKVVKQWADRKKTVYEPLFHCYVFAETMDSQHSLIREIDGVYNFVHWMGKPAVIRNEEIETLKSFLNEHKTVQLEKIPVNMNDTVRIISGPFMAQEGNVIEIRNHSVKVQLPSLGYAVIADIGSANVEIISSTIKSKSNDQFNASFR